MLYMYTAGDGIIMDVNSIYKDTQGEKAEGTQGGGMYVHAAGEPGGVDNYLPIL